MSLLEWFAVKRQWFVDFTGKSINFLVENSIFLVGGAAIAFFWVNYVDAQSYENIKDFLKFGINDIGMAFFFLIAAKEIREAMLPEGSLSSKETAALPVMATIGGMAGPVLIYYLGTQIFGTPELVRGCAIPMATDIAFSYLVARLIFQPSIDKDGKHKPHPAIAFLLLLAVTDDAIGLIVLAIFYPQEDIHTFITNEPNRLFFVGCLVISLLLTYILRRIKIVSFWPYLILPGVISWFGFHDGGIHPALALVPIVFLMPHSYSDMGLWAKGESKGKDTLNKMEHWFKTPVEIILGFFGFVNAGVKMATIGTGTGLVFTGLLVGKPLGIFLMTKLGQALKMKLPNGMNMRDLIVVGFAAGIGFTVALFVAVAAYQGGSSELDSLKMGALFSFLVFPTTLMIAKFLQVGKYQLAVEPI